MKKELYYISVLKEELNALNGLRLQLLPHIGLQQEGTLNVCGTSNKPQFYMYCKEDKSRKYLGLKDIGLVKQLAQQSYEEDILDMVESREKIIEKLIKNYETTLEECYNSLCPERKKLVVPRVLSDEEYIKKWYEENPGFQNHYPYAQTFYTLKGEAVRSKSEKIIADLLFSLDIPYVYEPLILVNGQYRVPDFLILNIYLREEIIYEHFGMADDPGYMEKTIIKVNEYQNAGYILGKKLIMSFESKDNPIDIKATERMIKNCFKKYS